MSEVTDKIPPPEIIGLVATNEIQNIKALLLKGEGKVTDVDTNGMTPLHHAAFKGNAELCKLFLDHGADVNDDSHDHKYAPLHFAALSGDIETVQLLLENNARPYHVNTLGRTAAQMAAFVGNHAVVALINNYIPLKDVSYYASPQGLDTEPKLMSTMVKPLYDLILQVNLHPVKIALTVEKSKDLQINISKAVEVLNLMREKENKRPENVNEIICIKLHYLSYVLKTLEKENKKMTKEMNEEKKTAVYESIIKKWLRARSSDGFEEHLEYYIRDAIKSFPHPEMPLFIQLVQNLSGSRVGDSWALGTLSGCVNGQRAFHDEQGCMACGDESKNIKKCSRCKTVRYCTTLCQKLHWGIHKKFCEKIYLEKKKDQEEIDKEKQKEEEKNQKAEVLKNDEEKENQEISKVPDGHKELTPSKDTEQKTT
ncbi:ankyrin repeat and MYND domain-containing protein 2-like [Palaemon carinicauda]|uniref:ankyrin repeat and MYND domain-containing protein 2-like n=1 Tax=Palaemon carinicauda TaxID=392227 RepID=UPI0035B57C14